MVRPLVLREMLLVASLVGVDQLSKVYAERALLLHGPWPTMADHRSRTSTMLDLTWGHASFGLDLTHVANGGITFGTLEDLPAPWPGVIFYGASMVALALMGLFLRRSSNGMTRWGALVVVSGVVGNLIDRLRLGYVIDWLDLRARVGHWNLPIPAFNVADTALAIGLGLLAWGVFTTHRSKQNTPV